jgi:hypothetical protein
VAKFVQVTIVLQKSTCLSDQLSNETTSPIPFQALHLPNTTDLKSAEAQMR